MFDWNTYGALHLVLLHVPIGLFVGILALEVGLNREKHQETYDTAMGVLLPLCLLTSILTVRFGYALAETDYNWEDVADHRQFGLSYVYLLGTATLCFWWNRWRENNAAKGLYAVFLSFSFIALILTGHSGATLTHGPAVLDDALPFLKDNRRAIEEQNSATQSDSAKQSNTAPANPFTTEAYAILDAHCIECHGLNKRKGGYRIDVPRLARAGGDSHKPGIVPGKPDESELIIRAELPKGEEGAMPPGKRAPLTPEQLAVLRSWIEAGGQFPGEATKTEAKLDPKTVKQLDALRDLGAAADFTPWGDGTVLVNLSQMESPDWKLCHTKLKPLAGKLVWLNAANQKWQPEFYAQLKNFPQLQRLHLENSNVTDADLAKLAMLKDLSYLNLSSTKITESGLKTALALPALTELYVHGIDVTPKALNELRAQHDAVDIAGLSVKEFPKEEKK
ncbi:c-type cytochrome domain-containing protein [Cerasicoccus maritimus]|uniref:c-type cytochrome domain-containing protein n=1 Tax=Cerasicoccus maritimus TaxID=490089 RepID=UPI002852C9D3|nr:c-type cytochrome domain-containing protein [Cerasicoccus maritimus]